jgi:hypothetical protein
VPFFVMVRHQVQVDRLDHVLTSMRTDFATSGRRHPGRRGTRVFQRLDSPTDLLAMGVWDVQDDYERLRNTRDYVANTVGATPPASIDYLKRLRMFARMSTTPAIYGCVTMEAPPSQGADLERHLLIDVSPPIEAATGLLLREVYRIGDEPGRALVVHGWRAPHEMEGFRFGESKRHDVWLEERRISISTFTGVMAAQFSRLETQP